MVQCCRARFPSGKRATSPSYSDLDRKRYVFPFSVKRRGMFAPERGRCYRRARPMSVQKPKKSHGGLVKLDPVDYGDGNNSHLADRRTHTLRGKRPPTRGTAVPCHQRFVAALGTGKKVYRSSPTDPCLLIAVVPPADSLPGAFWSNADLINLH